MSKTLLESNFLTIDLSAITGKSASTTPNMPNNKPEANSGPVTDWGAEYEKRVADNKALDSESRISDGELDNTFFTEYFEANWGKDVADLLLAIGEPLKKIFKALKFKPDANPILAFISDTYVLDNLIKTKLLNAVTFRAIYNAVANRWIADKEWYQANDYNIIYCRDLYKKSAAEMAAYLKQQKNELSPSKSPYSDDLTSTNKKVFFNIEDITEAESSKRAQAIKAYKGALPSALDSNTTLNNIDLVKILVGPKAFEDESGETGKNAHLSSDAIRAKVAKLDNLAKKFAALVYLNIAYNSEAARKGLKDQRFGNISSSEITKATVEIQTLFSKAKYPANEIQELVDAILASLN